MNEGYRFHRKKEVRMPRIKRGHVCLQGGKSSVWVPVEGTAQRTRERKGFWVLRCPRT